MRAPATTAGMPAEGTIKFTVGARVVTAALAPDEYLDVERYRSRLRRSGLIGHDAASGYGYGNISRRRPDGGFVISGTQTGHKPDLDGADYVIVEGWDFAAATVSCRGPCLPSSESLSHAALYRRQDIGAVIHVHSRPMWESLIRDGALSTEEDIPYGSEALFRRLAGLVCGPDPLGHAETAESVGQAGSLRTAGDPDATPSLRSPCPAALPGPDAPSGPAVIPGLPVVIVTKGHEDGVFAAGRDLAEAYALVESIREGVGT